MMFETKDSTKGGRMSKKRRCDWAEQDPTYIDYHDKEWGIPVYDSRALFEQLLLEGAQAGLSWLTILKKRDNYKNAFAKFDPQQIALYDEKMVEILKENKGIVRNKLKIRAFISNSQLYLEQFPQKDDFKDYVWSFVDGKVIKNHFSFLEEVPSTSKESNAMAKDLKKRGFKFVGSTICYAFMQASGLVNDHLKYCFCYPR
jgi:DNA-3-methyladenine glycosylase I